MRVLAPLALLTPIVLAAAPTARAADRILRTEITLDAPQAEVWKAWTTEEGVKSFFAPGCHIEPHVDGAYEIFFNPAAEPGQRGGDGLRILAFEPERRLAFTWNAPPTNPYVRAQRTMVVVELRPLGPKQTRLRFTHLGWGEGPEWDAAYAYFDTAWRSYVLPGLVYRFTTGPIDWKSPPRLPPVAESLRATLTASP
jgi:uncharacterized protein YndB with AHSA1/START domain